MSAHLYHTFPRNGDSKKSSVFVMNINLVWRLFDYRLAHVNCAHCSTTLLGGKMPTDLRRQSFESTKRAEYGSSAAWKLSETSLYPRTYGMSESMLDWGRCSKR